MTELRKQSPFPDTEAMLATIARLFAVEGDLLAVDVLSSAKPNFEWYSHDNWDGGFDIFNLYLQTPFKIFTIIGENRQTIEQKILDKLQALSRGHTVDHIQSVSIILEVIGSKDWRPKAQAWIRGDESEPSAKGLNNLANQIIIKPEIFKIPTLPIDDSNVAVMMPFSAEFNKTYEAIKKSCISVGLKPIRADDMWSNSTFIQDIFDIIYCSKIVIVDFSKRNPNVMYETGIAHTLGRHVIPVTRSIEDVPSDLQHHRALLYLQNDEGLESLSQGLMLRLSTITGREPKVI